MATRQTIFLYEQQAPPTFFVMRSSEFNFNELQADLYFSKAFGRAFALTKGPPPKGP